MAQSLSSPLARAPRPTGRAGAWLLTLFSLPFCAVGVFMAGRAITGLGRGEPLGEALALRLVFALTFGGAGFGLLFYSRWAAARAAAHQALRERHPDEPWRWRPEWASGRVPAQDGAVAVVAWIFAVFWNAISLPLLWQVPRALERGEAAAAWGLLFPLVGAGLLVWAVRATLRRRRFGRCVLELGTRPGVVGGPFRGTLHVPSEVRPPDGFQVTLTCVHRVTSGHGKNRSTSESVRWQEEATVPPTQVMAAAVGSAFPVEFTVPGDVPESSAVSSDDEYVWRLAARAALPGIDFQSTFEVPVFRTEESRDDLRTAAALATDAAPLSASPAPIRPGSRITVAATPDGVALHLPAARNPAGAVMLTVMALFWNGLVGFMAVQAPMPVLPFLAIFLLVGALIAFAALAAWLGSVRLRARPGELSVTSRMLGIGRTRVYAGESLGDLRIEPNGHVGNTVFYALKASRPGRKRGRTLANGLGDRAEAERVLGLLEGALAA
jgi:hypothetical protein